MASNPDFASEPLEKHRRGEEPVEHLQIFTTLHEFFRGFKRSRGEEFSTYDTRFRAQLQKMEEIGAPLDGLVRSYWFLEGSGISAELRKQVISAAGGSYDYEKLRAALVAIVPTVKRDEQESHGRPHNASGQERTKFERREPKPHGVHTVDEDGEGLGDGTGEDVKDQLGRLTMKRPSPWSKRHRSHSRKRPNEGQWQRKEEDISVLKALRRERAGSNI